MLKLNGTVVNGTIVNGMEVLVTSNISLELSGKAILHYRLKRSLNYDLRPRRPLSDFEFLRVNEFPTRLVQLRCSDFISPEWDCTKMADKCSRVLNEIGAMIMISNHTLQKHHSYNLLDSFATLDHICTISKQLRKSFKNRKITCTGPERLFTQAQQQCQIFFNCVDTVLETLLEYSSTMNE